MRISIENDLFGIADRLKSIDEDYAVFYDKDNGKFELHSMRSIPTLQLILPFETLDKRVVDYALKTRVHVIIEEISAIDEYNDGIELKRDERKLDEIKRKLSGALAYLERGGEDLPNFSSL